MPNVSIRNSKVPTAKPKPRGMSPIRPREALIAYDVAARLTPTMIGPSVSAAQ